MLPVGAAHHQKLVVVDDAIAVIGGLDLTIRRWDTSDHAADQPLRTDPAGQPYTPFHDLQLMLDGAAATALAEVARGRWPRVTGVRLPPKPNQDGATDLWQADRTDESRVGTE